MASIVKPLGPLSTDELLRKHGFTIASRPSGGEPRWRRKGCLWTETQAIKQSQREEDQDNDSV